MDFAGVGTDDMAAEHAIGGGVGKNFHEPILFAERGRAGVGGERELANAIFDACLLQLLLGLSDRGDLGVGVNDARDRAVVHMTRLPGDYLGDGHALVFSLVG